MDVQAPASLPSSLRRAERIPTIASERLVLGPFGSEEAAAVTALVDDPAMARYTLNIPHPYPPGAAAVWIAGHAAEFESGEGVVFAVRLVDGPLVGCMGLKVERGHDRGTLGYWIGLPFWGRGYATEGARTCLAFGFRHFDLNKIVASYLAENPASGRVMEKLEMAREGVHPRHTKKNGAYHDLLDYGLLRETFDASQRELISLRI